jgi:hypothetical protein
MSDVVISQRSCHVVVSKEQWLEIEKADKDFRLYQFNGRMPGLILENGERLYIRCVAGVAKWDAWELTDLKVSEAPRPGWPLL